MTIGLAPQLTLEAAILMHGGFADLGPVTPRRALYLKLGGGADGGEARDAAEKDEDIAELAERHFAELKILLDQFADPDTPYLSRPMPKFASRFADYDHLARVKEWSKAGGAGEPAAETPHEPAPRHSRIRCDGSRLSPRTRRPRPGSRPTPAAARRTS